MAVEIRESSARRSSDSGFGTVVVTKSDTGGVRPRGSGIGDRTRLRRAPGGGGEGAALSSRCRVSGSTHSAEGVPMPRLAPIAAFVALFVIGGAQAASAQLVVNPLTATLRPADGTASVVIPVLNSGADTVDVVVDVNDWRVDEEGRHHFVPGGTLEGSCGARMRPESAGLRIAPGETARLRVFYDGGAADRCRNIVFMRVTEMPDALGGDRLIVSTGVKIYVEQ
jgi:hypothetical protein